MGTMIMRTMRIIFMTVSAVTAQVWASNVTIPNTFVNGTTASADEVNANFDSIESAVNDNDARINSIRTIRVFVNGSAIGAFLETFGNNPNLITAEYIRVLLNSGYHALVSTAGDGLREVPLRYQSADCTGQPYFGVPDPATLNPIVIKNGIVLLNDTPAPDTLYFVAAGTVIENVTVQSSRIGGVCTALGPATYRVVQVSVNDSVLTGVADNLAGNITIGF